MEGRPWNVLGSTPPFSQWESKAIRLFTSKYNYANFSGISGTRLGPFPHFWSCCCLHCWCAGKPS